MPRMADSLNTKPSRSSVKGASRKNDSTVISENRLMLSSEPCTARALRADARTPRDSPDIKKYNRGCVDRRWRMCNLALISMLAVSCLQG